MAIASPQQKMVQKQAQSAAPTMAARAAIPSQPPPVVRTGPTAAKPRLLSKPDPRHPAPVTRTGPRPPLTQPGIPSQPPAVVQRGPANATAASQSIRPAAASAIPAAPRSGGAMYGPNLNSQMDTRTETIEGRIGGLLQTDRSGNYTNAVVRQAQERAMQQAASRGVLNSSMAMQAAQEAAIANAVSIASPDADRAYGNRRSNVDASNVFARDAQLNDYTTSRDATQHGYNLENRAVDHANTTTRDTALAGHTTARDAAMHGYDTANRTLDHNNTMTRDSALAGHTTTRDNNLAGHTTARDNNLAGQTTARDAALHGQTMQRDTAQAGVQTARDAALHGYTTSRDASLHGQTLQRDSAQAGYTTARDATLASQTLTRDAAQAGQVMTRDAALHGQTVQRDNNLHTNTTGRDAALAQQTLDRDRGQQAFESREAAAAATRQTERDATLNSQTVGRENAERAYQDNRLTREQSQTTRAAYQTQVGNVVANFQRQVDTINASNMKPSEKTKAIQQAERMRDGEVAYVNNIYSRMPDWRNEWLSPAVSISGTSDIGRISDRDTLGTMANDPALSAAQRAAAAARARVAPAPAATRPAAAPAPTPAGSGGPMGMPVDPYEDEEGNFVMPPTAAWNNDTGGD